jgi:hypothetical protein
MIFLELESMNMTERRNMKKMMVTIKMKSLMLIIMKMLKIKEIIKKNMIQKKWRKKRNMMMVICIKILREIIMETECSGKVI